MGQDQHKIEWREGVPISTRFDDPFYSLDDGLAETRHVFLAGNDLPGRFADGFHVAELGFGTGLNFLATLAAFRDAGVAGRLHFTSFEAYPMDMADLRAALSPYPTLPADALLAAAADTLPTRIEGADFVLNIILGDARDTLARWDGRADAWYLDGFSPAKNPEMWGAELLQMVRNKTTPGGTFATYTAVGDIRRALASAGFTVERVAGYGRKRHMTRGRVE
ncbi:tRNA (5-methylaminomethyl-2-thiouridine)(34)-methyltransferase MnmD [Hasllibacter sp. MH4015]|uniref:tRNA (5-methylaminomethyl-2-thiouridine)(34)-methyltransferase MnmD n=1 Tax=Hasllibacter sp. MH4015 TaxID=2854029 RepID=UPI001CD759AF|nr:tRNA (5-methylaminomethyl-2-thiouridine)(34)-methyltransferase MnmD [Hasllibacter sp. MH4015]